MMKLSPIIVSLLDTDLYKFNMNQVMFHKRSDLVGKYMFKCRNKDVEWTQEMVDEINAQLDHLCTLRFTDEELKFLGSLRFMKKSFIDFLSFWYPKRECIEAWLEGTTLKIEATGSLFAVMQFEIYVLEIVNEVYFKMKYSTEEYRKIQHSAEEYLDQMIDRFKSGEYTFKFADFGCRRRLSREWQDIVVHRFATETKNLVGTSNVYLAMKYHLTPIGTYAHEYVQMYQGIKEIPLAMTNKVAMQDWFEEYQGDNGTALTDTLSTDLFLLDYTRSEVNNYSGVRHDSGDPYTWGEKIIAHWRKYNINPMTKTLLFSDSLDFDRAQALYDYFSPKALVGFGIGTFVTNHTCVPALNIVMKLQYVNGYPVAKLSDNPEKAMCDDKSYLKHLKESVDFRNQRGE